MPRTPVAAHGNMGGARAPRSLRVRLVFGGGHVGPPPEALGQPDLCANGLAEGIFSTKAVKRVP
jgi:hypothetical protein